MDEAQKFVMNSVFSNIHSLQSTDTKAFETKTLETKVLGKKGARKGINCLSNLFIWKGLQLLFPQQEFDQTKTRTQASNRL
jgi:hypothetical protein